MTDPELSKQHIPSIQEASAAYADILEHNAQHTGFGAIFSGIFETVTETLEVGHETAEAVYEKVGEKLEQKAVEGDMAAELQDIFHSDLFMHAGLKILPSGSHMANGEGKRVSSERLEPFVVNTQLFADFLKEISPEDAQTENNPKLLLDATANLKYIIGSCIAPSRKTAELAQEQGVNLNEIAEDGLRTWDAIESEYARLGLSADTMRERLQRNPKDSEAQRQLHILGGLEQYVEYWGKGLLPEFIKAWNKGYITPAEEFYYWPPARWAEDMSPDELSDRWEKAMNFIEALKEKEGAGDLLLKVRANLELSLTTSLTSMQEQEISSTKYYEEALRDWQAHGEKPYKITEKDGTMTEVSWRPDDGSEYFHNNRLSLEAARLRFQEL